ncbi:MAG: sodium:calcium antiporter [Bacilli bacterium]
MIFILFVLLSFFIVFISIKLSTYIDYLDKTTKLSGMILGGILLSVITSTPELITSITSLYLDNAEMALGDILGSNMFNLFILGTLCIFYMKQLYRYILPKSFATILLSIFFIYFSMIYFIEENLIIFNTFSVISIIIFIIYFIFIKNFSNNDSQNKIIKVEIIKYIKIKIIIFSILLIVSSIFLTNMADYICHTNIFFKASTIGAFLLGITTSLPEVSTTVALFKFKNFNMGFANIIGSNMFNLFVLIILDLLTINNNIFTYVDIETIYIIRATLVMNIMMACYIYLSGSNKILRYIISIITVLSYLFVWCNLIIS